MDTALYACRERFHQLATEKDLRLIVIVRSKD